MPLEKFDSFEKWILFLDTAVILLTIVLALSNKVMLAKMIRMYTFIPFYVAIGIIIWVNIQGDWVTFLAKCIIVGIFVWIGSNCIYFLFIVKGSSFLRNDGNVYAMVLFAISSVISLGFTGIKLKYQKTKDTEDKQKETDVDQEKLKQMQRRLESAGLDPHYQREFEETTPGQFEESSSEQSLGQNVKAPMYANVIIQLRVAPQFFDNSVAGNSRNDRKGYAKVRKEIYIDFNKYTFEELFDRMQSTLYYDLFTDEQREYHRKKNISKKAISFLGANKITENTKKGDLIPWQRSNKKLGERYVNGLPGTIWFYAINVLDLPTDLQDTEEVFNLDDSENLDLP